MLKEAIPETWRMRLADLRGRGIYAGYPDAYKCIFIHIPKTAGSSAAQALFGTDSRHIAYTEYLKANPGKFRAYFKFAFVRNPWDRLVSSFFFLKAGGLNELDRKWAADNIVPFVDFRDFVINWVTEENIHRFVHFLPQAHFVADSADRIQVDFIGRFENIQHDFGLIARKIGRDVSLPVSNRSDHRHFADYYDGEMHMIVRRVYARDIALFGYGSNS